MTGDIIKHFFQTSQFQETVYLTYFLDAPNQKRPLLYQRNAHYLFPTMRVIMFSSFPTVQFLYMHLHSFKFSLTFIMDAYRKQNKLFVQWETDELSQTSTHKQTHTSLVPLGQLASLSKEVYVCLCSDAWQSSSVRCLY